MIDNNDSGPSERRDHEGAILSKRQSSRVKTRINCADDDDKSDPEDSKVIQKIQGLNMTKWLF